MAKLKGQALERLVVDILRESSPIGSLQISFQLEDRFSRKQVDLMQVISALERLQKRGVVKGCWGPDAENKFTGGAVLYELLERESLSDASSWVNGRTKHESSVAGA